MTNKLVLDAIIRENPNKNDLLVYDTKLKAFVETSREDFLKETDTKISELKQEIKDLNLQIEKFKTQMSQMAKIIKERVI